MSIFNLNLYRLINKAINFTYIHQFLITYKFPKLFLGELNLKSFINFIRKANLENKTRIILNHY